MAKFLDGMVLTKMLKLLNCRLEQGRADSTPHFASDVFTAPSTSPSSSHYPASAANKKAPGVAVSRPPPLPAAALDLRQQPPHGSTAGSCSISGRHPRQAVSTHRQVRFYGRVYVLHVPAVGRKPSLSPRSRHGSRPHDEHRARQVERRGLLSSESAVCFHACCAMFL